MKDSPWEPRPDESSEAFEAFRLYRDAGTDRSIRSVGQRLGKSGSLVSRWASQYEWSYRAQAWEAEQDRARRDASLDAVQEVSRERAKALEAQFDALTLPGRELLRRVNADRELLSTIDPKTLVELVARCARPAVQVAEALDELRGTGTPPGSEACCEHEAARRRAAAMTREEAEAYLLGNGFRVG